MINFPISQATSLAQERDILPWPILLVIQTVLFLTHQQYIVVFICYSWNYIQYILVSKCLNSNQKLYWVDTSKHFLWFSDNFYEWMTYHCWWNMFTPIWLGLQQNIHGMMAFGYPIVPKFKTQTSVQRSWPEGRYFDDYLQKDQTVNEEY